jgi:membrane associated rhomboid family serine protease
MGVYSILPRMIPLRDTIPSNSFPLITIALIVVNTLIYFHEQSLGPAAERFVLHYGFVPARYLHFSHTEPWNVVERFGPMFSSMFLHGGLLHLLGNMWTLWIFGDNVEDRLGKGRFLFYYLACGLAAVYMHYLTGQTSGTPVIGASGAIAGIMGGYFVLFPHARMVTLVPIFIFIQIVTLPAIVFLFLWFLMQLVNGFVASAAQAGGGVAWWAHVGGFLTGAAVMMFLRHQHSRLSRRPSDIE